MYLESQKEDWALEAQVLYSEKIKRFSDFEILKIKSPAVARDNKDYKVEEETKLILSKLKPDYYPSPLEKGGKPFDPL